jgi:hypothetical protein
VVDQSEVTPIHFDSVAKLAAFIKKKRAEGTVQLEWQPPS